MKKIRNFPSYIKLLRRRKKRAFKKTRKRYYAKAFTNIDVLKQIGYVYMIAPNNFSLVNNPNIMIWFLNRLKKIVSEGKSVLLDFADITEVTNDGLISLLSIIQDGRVPSNVRIKAKKPKDQKLRKRLKESGISQESTGLGSEAAAKYGRFRQKSSLSADMEEANELIKFATKEIFGRRDTLKDVQRIFGECIDNTTYHANPKKPMAERWWGTVFCNNKTKTAYFSVLDNGVGIIESLKVGWAKKIEFLFSYENNAALLRAVFQGGVLSSTGQSNRGNGLPNIFKARERRQFTRLIVISNNVYVDFDKDNYQLLQHSFNGTFFYWEVRNEDDDATTNTND